ncbi:MAG: hypothetical protein HGA44_08515 [Cellulomonadaceae bacterium]|nr:hypothetical protein [Cellulomonadaceae bacterium]
MHALVTTVLDLLGALALVAAAALAVGLLLGWPGALAATGGGLLLVSWLIDRQARQARNRRNT